LKKGLTEKETRKLKISLHLPSSSKPDSKTPPQEISLPPGSPPDKNARRRKQIPKKIFIPASV
jgi:hypothetical protein